jgi:hypothetical protein
MDEKTKLFLKELADLMEKHNAELSAKDEWTGYAECGEDIQIRLEIKDVYDDIAFGGYIDAEKLRTTATDTDITS